MSAVPTSSYIIIVNGTVMAGRAFTCYRLQIIFSPLMVVCTNFPLYSESWGRSVIGPTSATVIVDTMKGPVDRTVDL